MNMSQISASTEHRIWDLFEIFGKSDIFQIFAIPKCVILYFCHCIGNLNAFYFTFLKGIFSYATYTWWDYYIFLPTIF